MDNITFAEAHNNLIYERWNGDLYWKYNQFNRPEINTKYAGKQAGFIRQDGYRLVSINGKSEYAHRIIYLMMTGKYPDGEIDHYNRNRSDNRWSNLKDVPRKINTRNRSMSSNNTSGYANISSIKRKGEHRGWHVSIGCADEKYRKNFKELADAIQWRDSIIEQLPGFTPTHGKEI